MKHQMSIQSIKIKIGNETKELTIKEAKALKDALDELFPQRTLQWMPPAHVYDYPSKLPPNFDPMRVTCEAKADPYCPISDFA